MSDYLTIEKLVDKVFVNFFSKSFADMHIRLSTKIENKIIYLVFEYEHNLVLDQEMVSNQLKAVIVSTFKDISDVRTIFNNPIHKNPTPKTVNKIKHKFTNIERVVLVASAKGGVGKSTIAANTAIALANLGYSVGIIDADIYGPTLPKILGINQKPEVADGKMLPIFKNGIFSISIGYLVDESQAAFWRGPMISKALFQLFVGVKWPKLDYLIVDMPPGTGDIYLSIAENFEIDGVLLVTMPQNIVNSILQKSISFFKKTTIPILGLIENMSYFFDQKTNQKHYIFGKRSPSSEKYNEEIELLKQIPILSEISEFSDCGYNLNGLPIFSNFMDIAKKIDKRLHNKI